MRVPESSPFQIAISRSDFYRMGTERVRVVGGRFVDGSLPNQDNFPGLVDYAISRLENLSGQLATPQ